MPRASISTVLTSLIKMNKYKNILEQVLHHNFTGFFMSRNTLIFLTFATFHKTSQGFIVTNLQLYPCPDQTAHHMQRKLLQPWEPSIAKYREKPFFSGQYAFHTKPPRTKDLATYTDRFPLAVSLPIPAMLRYLKSNMTIAFGSFF